MLMCPACGADLFKILTGWILLYWVSESPYDMDRSELSSIMMNGINVHGYDI